jgi:hypothetical protein
MDVYNHITCKNGGQRAIGGRNRRGDAVQLEPGTIGPFLIFNRIDAPYLAEKMVESGLERRSKV